VYCEGKDFLHFKMPQSGDHAWGYSIRYSFAVPVLMVNYSPYNPHPYNQAKPTEEAANEATNTGKEPEGF
jgi:hypothetical protein